MRVVEPPCEPRPPNGPHALMLLMPLPYGCPTAHKHE